MINIEIFKLTSLRGGSESSSDWSIFSIISYKLEPAKECNFFIESIFTMYTLCQDYKNLFHIIKEESYGELKQKEKYRIISFQKLRINAHMTSVAQMHTIKHTKTSLTQVSSAHNSALDRTKTCRSITAWCADKNSPTWK